MNRPLFSIVSPVYKAEKIVTALVRSIKESVETITDNYEIILVCDGSPDNSWHAIKEECVKNKRVVGINLSRNFGQHYAITAGLHYAKGDWIVVMDCDLQDRPEEIPNLYKKAQEGFDIVYARRLVRQDGFLKKQSSLWFHRVYNWLSGLSSDSAIANFGIYRNRVIEELNKMPEHARSFPSLVQYLGFNSVAIDVKHGERAEGKSSYNLNTLLKLGFDVIVSNSNKPLRMSVGLGFGMAALSFLLALYNVIAKWVGIIEVPGYTTTVFSIWFVGGLMLFVMGMLGIYIGKIFDQVKGRQLYVVKDEVNV